MDPFSIASAGMGAVSAIGSLIGGLSAAAEKRAQTDEMLRRQRLQQAQVFGKATASAAASGAEFDSSSIQVYLDAMKQEFARENAWVAQQGAAASSNLAWAGGLTAFSDVGRTVMNLGAANNWWRSPSPMAPVSEPMRFPLGAGG